MLPPFNKKQSSLVAILSCQVAVGAAFAIPDFFLKVKRGGPQTDATLYAYGTSTSGWPISYGVSDGLLYISDTETSVNSTSDLTGITFDLSSITGEDWIVNGTLSNGTAAGSLYIIASAELNAVGVRDTAIAEEMAGTTTGFALLATQLVYNNNSTLESQFWARTTRTDSVYALMWNKEGDLEDDSFPVVVNASENAGS